MVICWNPSSNKRERGHAGGAPPRCLNDIVATTLGTVNHKCLQRIQPHYRRRAKAHRPDAGTMGLDRCTHEAEEVELVCGLHARKSDVHPLPCATTSSALSMRRRCCGGELHLLIEATHRSQMKHGQSVGVSVAFISAAVRTSPLSIPLPLSTISFLPHLLQYEVSTHAQHGEAAGFAAGDHADPLGSRGECHSGWIASPASTNGQVSISRSPGDMIALRQAADAITMAVIGTVDPASWRRGASCRG